MALGVSHPPLPHSSALLVLGWVKGNLPRLHQEKPYSQGKALKRYLPSSFKKLFPFLVRGVGFEPNFTGKNNSMVKLPGLVPKRVQVHHSKMRH